MPWGGKGVRKAWARHAVMVELGTAWCNIRAPPQLEQSQGCVFVLENCYCENHDGSIRKIANNMLIIY